MSLAKIALGLTGMLVAFLLSLVASGWDVSSNPYIVLVESNVSKRVFELANLTIGRPYTSVKLTVTNKGEGELTVSLASRSHTLSPGGSTGLTVSNILDYITFEFKSSRGRAEVVVETTWREGVKPHVSLVAVVILVFSMILASYGIIEHVILRRL